MRLRNAGFSLLELIAAMTILVIVIGIMGRILLDTQRTWRMGADRARMAASARATFAILENDLSAAVCSSNFWFLLDEEEGSDKQFSELIFFRLAPSAVTYTNRFVQLVHWAAETNANELLQLKRATEEFDAQDGYLPDMSDLSDLPDTPLLQNITAIEMLAGSVTNILKTTYDSVYNAHRLPQLVDVRLSLLPERLARRIPPLENPEIHSTIFHYRIYLPNHAGGRLP